MRPFAALVIALLVTSPLYAAKDADLFAAAKAAREKNEPQKAADLLEQAIKINPNKAEYHLLLAEAYGTLAENAGMFKQASLAKKAKAELERALQIDPRSFEARNGMISFYLQAPAIMGGSVEKALEQAAAIKKIDALRGHRAYVRIYMHEKKPDLARKEGLEAVRTMPTSGEAHFFLGNLYFNDKNWAAALREYDTALKLAPNFMPTRFRIGVLAAESNSIHARGEEALKAYLAYKPVADEPNHGSAWYYLGKLYEIQGRKADAKQAYLNAQKIAPKSSAITDALKRVS